MTSWIASIRVGRWTSVYPLTSSASFLSFRVSSTWESSCLSGRNKIPGEDWLLDSRIPSAFGVKTPSSWLNVSSNSQWVNYLYDFTLKWVTVWMYKIEKQATEHVEYLKVKKPAFTLSLFPTTAFPSHSARWHTVSTVRAKFQIWNGSKSGMFVPDLEQSIPQCIAPILLDSNFKPHFNYYTVFFESFF